MAWYKSPIKPLDPIIEDQKDNLAIRYLRDSFDSSGQDSNVQPPAQDQSMWQQLTNIQPITQGCLSRRWGYQLLTKFAQTGSGGSFFPLAFEGFSSAPAAGTISSVITRMYSFQNNISLSRQLVYSSVGGVLAGSESGGGTTVFSPSSLLPPRMVDSRNFGYFYDGIQGDLLKWDGTQSGNNVTKWGIAAPSSLTLSTSVGPFGPQTFVGQVGTGTAWANPSNSLTPNGQYATVSPAPVSQGLVLGNFNFHLPVNGVVTGIKAEVLGFYSGPPVQHPALIATLTKAGVPYGESRSAPIVKNSNVYVSFNTNNSDLWGASSNWLPADINNTGFGLQLTASSDVGNQSISVDYVRITIFYATVSGAVIPTPVPGGLVNLTVGRSYYCICQNSITGHFSDLNAPGVSTGPVSGVVVSLTGIPTSTDSQVDSKIILATADGGDPGILYFVASIPNSQTTYIDNTAETSLVLNQQYLFTDPFGNEFGVTFNDPPPNGSLCIKHKGRLWMALQQNLFFSKSISELTLPNGFIAGKYEEAWPPQNYFDISAGAETISGLFSDGNVLYVGTQSHIRRIFGDSPSNFQQPEICHQNVGVLNQETWQNVYLEGTPTGFMWLSPDFKVMGSDGNTYLDVGHPIQDVLNSINPLAAQNSHAMFVQQGPFDLYILAVPTGSNTYCDTHCVFDMRNQKWYIWQPTDQSSAMLFNVSASGIPMWLFATADGTNVNVYQYMSSATQDRVGNSPLDFAAIAQTSWLHLGSPTTKKILDELEVIGDPSMNITIGGASTQSDFNSPIVIVNAVTPVVSPFQTYKTYLSSKATRYRYYQLQFQSLTGANPILLNSFALRAIPWNTL